MRRGRPPAAAETAPDRRKSALSATPKCRCGPVTRPVAPTLPIIAPAFTCSPACTSMSLRWQYIVMKSAAVIEDHRVAVEEEVARVDHASIGGGPHRRAGVGGDVHAPVRIARLVVEYAPRAVGARADPGHRRQQPQRRRRSCRERADVRVDARLLAFSTRARSLGERSTLRGDTVRRCTVYCLSATSKPSAPPSAASLHAHRGVPRSLRKRDTDDRDPLPASRTTSTRRPRRSPAALPRRGGDRDERHPAGHELLLRHHRGRRIGGGAHARRARAVTRHRSSGAASRDSSLGGHAGAEAPRASRASISSAALDGGRVADDSTARVGDDGEAAAQGRQRAHRMQRALREREPLRAAGKVRAHGVCEARTQLLLMRAVLSTVSGERRTSRPRSSARRSARAAAAPACAPRAAAPDHPGAAPAA